MNDQRDMVRIVTDAVGRQYSRRGVLSLVGKFGLGLAGVAAGVGLPAVSEACYYPPPQCQSACVNCGGVFCVVLNTECRCYGPTCPYVGGPCYRATGIAENLCAVTCNCVLNCAPC